MTKKNIEKLAMQIRNLCIKHEVWIDTIIYFNGKAISTDDGDGHYGYNDPAKLYVREDMNPKDYFEYVGDILSMSFEGPLYDIFNYGSNYGGFLDEFNRLLKQYGLYYELGNAWNLSLFEI